MYQIQDRIQNIEKSPNIERMNSSFLIWQYLTGCYLTNQPTSTQWRSIGQPLSPQWCKHKLQYGCNILRKVHSISNNGDLFCPQFLCQMTNSRFIGKKSLKRHTKEKLFYTKEKLFQTPYLLQCGIIFTQKTIKYQKFEKTNSILSCFLKDLKK